jgi:Domain of unknown function (DUF4280)
MAQLVTMSATLACSFGAATSNLIVLPVNKTIAEKKPAANIMDNVPIDNIPPFGMCSAPTNPEVISETAAALGVLTPAPCVPSIPAPWAPGSPTVTIGGMPALNSTSKCMCAWAGVIQITAPGTTQTNVA